MVEKRKDFVEKNFQVLPRVYRFSLDVAGIQQLMKDTIESLDH
jgi:hypothetical protein